MSKEGRYEIRPSSSFLFPFLESLGAHTCANVRIPSSFLSHASRAVSTYQHLEGVHRLRLISMCLLKPSAPFRRRVLRAEVARCSHSLEEIRFSNPSLGTVVFYDVDILQFCCLFLCTPRRKGQCDNDRELLRRQSTLQSSALKAAREASSKIVRSDIPLMKQRVRLSVRSPLALASDSFNRRTHPVIPLKRFLSCQSSVATCSSRVSAGWRVYCTSG